MFKTKPKQNKRNTRKIEVQEKETIKVKINQSINDLSVNQLKTKKSSVNINSDELPGINNISFQKSCVKFSPSSDKEYVVNIFS